MGETWVVSIVAGLFGLLFGSFLNVCALRWGDPDREPGDRSVAFPGSHCPKCLRPLSWYDNIPVFSWLALRGRCRQCGEPISVQYPLVELATALIWAGAFAAHGVAPEAFRGALFLTLLLGISVTDARFYIIPHEFSIGGAVLGAGMAALPGGIDLRQSLIGAAVGYGVFTAVGWGGTWLVKKLRPDRLEEMGVDQALGGGDIWMMMMIGSFLGVWGVALTIFLGSVLALAIFGVISLLTRRLVPFGIFLAAAGGISYVYGEAMIRWYLTSIVGLPG